MCDGFVVGGGATKVMNAGRVAAMADMPFWLQLVGSTITELQVVKNQGWMGPYVACMVVFMGMSYHFLFSLSKFMRRRLKS